MNSQLLILASLLLPILGILFISLARKKGKKISVYPISDQSWLDLGQWDEYEKALVKLKS